MSAYYNLIERTIDTEGVAIAHYEPTPAAQGAWNPHEQHMAPATGVICAELERFSPRHELRISRINLDIWGVIWFAPFTITTRTLRPGRTIELVESRLEAKGKTCIVATAWRMKISDTQEIAGLEDKKIPHFDQMTPWQGMQQWGGGFIKSMCFKTNDQHRAGQGIVWMNNDLDMIASEPTSSFVHLMGMVDTANGVATRIPAEEWAFPNVDLNINLLRLPQGRWLGVNTIQQYGTDGIGLTSSVLHDELGVFGRSEQTLTLRKLNHT